jgi:hypothetical protein
MYWYHSLSPTGIGAAPRTVVVVHGDARGFHAAELMQPPAVRRADRVRCQPHPVARERERLADAIEVVGHCDGELHVGGLRHVELEVRRHVANGRRGEIG